MKESVLGKLISNYWEMIKRGDAATNLAILRRFALSLCKQEKTAKVGIKVKRKSAGWYNDYVLTLLNIWKVDALALY